MGLRSRRSFSSDIERKLLIEDDSCNAGRKQLRYSRLLILFLVIFLGTTFVVLYTQINELRELKGSYDPRPLGTPQIRTDGSTVFNIAVITDLDNDSKDPNKKDTWHSYLKTGVLSMGVDGRSFSVSWNDAKDQTLTSSLSIGGRAMECSELVVFNHRLLTIDDRTGVIYEISNDKVLPWVMLIDGPGNVTKPLKGEWMTVKNEKLIVGGLGKEWTTPSGEFVNDHPMWVKEVDRNGRIVHKNWTHVYKMVRKSAGIVDPGYMVHEAVQWSDVHQKWFFLPRRASVEKYNEQDDEQRGTNMFISIEDGFEGPADVVRIGRGVQSGYKGFSSFQFVPGSDDMLVAALKSEEKDGHPVGSHLTIFNIMGAILMEDNKLQGQYKFEGLAFV